MSEKIYSAFNDLQMSDRCQQNILTAMHQNKNHSKITPRMIRITAAAACLIAVLLLLCNPTVVAALESTIASALEKITQEQKDGTTLVRYDSSDGKFYAEDIYREDGYLLYGRGRNNLLKTPAWYVEQNNRVYFAGNNEWIDVTDLISIDTPFTYVYTDHGGIVHYVAIGGVYDPDPELCNVGYAEWYYDPDFVDTHGIRGHWVGGYCDNYWNKDTDDDWPWLAKAKEDMGIPWG